MSEPTGYIEPRKSWPRPATPCDLTPAWAGEFNSFDDWVHFATQRLTGTHDPLMGYEVKAICVDALGRRCTVGGHFMRARDEGTFPVRFFWDMRPAPPVKEAEPVAVCPGCGAPVNDCCATTPALQARVEALEAWDWLAGQTNLSLDFQYSVDPEDEGAWVVDRVSGCLSDREWEEISRAATPLAAILTARAALTGGRDDG